MKQTCTARWINLLLCCSLFTATVAKAQVYGLNWAKSIGGSSADQGNAIVIDASGNVLSCGHFAGTADFDPGTSVFNLVTVSSMDGYVMKTDAGGNLVWADQFKGASFTSITDPVAVRYDAAGNVYVAGMFHGTVDFDPGAGTFNLTANGTDGSFICKLNSSGGFIWAKQFRGSANNRIKAMTLDGAGNIYTTGYFEDTTDFNPGTGTYNLITQSSGVQDIFVSKHDSAGSFVWADQLIGIGINAGNGIAVDGSGNVFVTGNFQGICDFDPSPVTDTFLTAGGSGGPGQDIFLLKLNSSGGYIWANHFGSGSDGAGNAIILDAFGNAYITGYFTGVTDFNPTGGSYALTTAGNGDIFVAKYNTTGNFFFAAGMGGAGLSDDAGSAITLDGTGNLYVTGHFSDIADFDPGTGTSNLTAVEASDVFVCRLTVGGSFGWAKQMGSNGDDYGLGIAVDGAVSIYTTGYFSDTADFDPTAGTFNLMSAGNSDIFVTKLSNVSLGLSNHKTLFADVYPNPTTGNVYADVQEKCSYSVTDVTGKLQSYGSVAPGKQEIDMHDLPAGVYMLQLQTGEGAISTVRVVKQ